MNTLYISICDETKQRFLVEAGEDDNLAIVCKHPRAKLLAAQLVKLDRALTLVDALAKNPAHFTPAEWQKQAKDILKGKLS